MLSPKQLKCVRLMAAGDKTQKQIAKEVKVSEQSICTWKKNPEFIEAYNQEIRQRLNYLPGRALHTLEMTMLFGEKDADRIRAARDILDRAGFGPAKPQTDAYGNELLDTVIYLPEKEPCDG